MPELRTFINPKFRPNVLGGNLDKTHQSIYYIFDEQGEKNNPTLIVNAICFGPKKDNVLINLEHAITKEENVLIFYYEDMHKRWSYIHTNDEEYFIFRKSDTEQYKVKPGCLYIRGCYIEPDDEYWVLLGDFFNFVDLWDGMVLCPPQRQMTNESKLFQINNSLRKSAKGCSSVSIGTSYVIKSPNQLRVLEKKSYIVKSLSGVRSIVVDENDYKQWCIDNLNNIPVLFQEKVDGNDIRIHIIDNKIFAKRSNSKDAIDYRYDSNFFKLSDMDNLEEDLVKFCLRVAHEEDNLLLGIDLIQTNAGYVVLEANPSPGWSAYHPFNGMDEEPFIVQLLRVLKSG